MPENSLELTVVEYELFPEDGRRHELVDGDHVVTPAPTVRHQRVAWRLARAFDQALAGRDRGEALFAPVDVVLSPTDVVQPDLVFVSRERAAIVGTRIEGAPDLVVEIVSPASRRTDEVLKRRSYERSGVKELWIVDPEVEVVRVYRRAGEGFARPVELSAERGDVVGTELVPGLALPVAELLAASAAD